MPEQDPPPIESGTGRLVYDKSKRTIVSVPKEALRLAVQVLHDSLQEWNTEEFCQRGWNARAAERAVADLDRAGYVIVPKQASRE